MNILSRKFLLIAAATASVIALSINAPRPALASETLIADSGRGQNFHHSEVDIIREYFLEAEEYERGKKKGHKKKFKNKKSKNSRHDRRYMSEKVKSRKGLPPGIMKQIREGKRIPDHVVRHDLPEYLRLRLPLPPRGTRRVLINNDIILIRRSTNLVLDIIENVLSRQ